MRIEEHGGSHVNDVERFDHVLPFAVGISANAGHIFEIDLPACQRGGPLHRLLDVLPPLSNPIVAFEHAINGLARGDRQLKELQHGIALEGIANGLLSGRPPQAFRRLVSNGEDLLDHQRMGRGGVGSCELASGLARSVLPARLRPVPPASV
jgi:hypothetical protein